MRKPTESIFEEIARSIAEGVEVDWEDLTASHPNLRSRIERFRDLERIARAVGKPEATEAARTWGTLEIREKIGEGSFGEVFRAFDPLLEREVALKLAFPRDEEFERHLEEARRLARVRHPNVLAIHGIEEHEGRSGIWTDLVRGETLEQRLEREGPFGIDALTAAGRDLCRALDAVHGVGLVHGDVKTSNVMVEADGRVVLMDFGAGTSSRWSDVPGRRAVVGTPLAMAPELLSGGTPSAASDLYAVGVLLYRLATGRYPIEATSWKQLLAQHRAGGRIPLHEARPDLPETITRATEDCLATEPGKRPESVTVLDAQLRVGGTPDPSIPTAEVDPHLPVVTTRFVGREEERRTIREAVLKDPLVTLTGAGGCGKTRLAHQAAVETAGAFKDGVRWIELASVHDPDFVIQVIARGCGVVEAAGQSTEEALIQTLGALSMLVVLDNCEQVLEACARITSMFLDAAPRVRILATSRRSMGLPREHTLQIPPMQVSRRADGLAILDSDAVRLFVDRADGFVLTNDNAPAVARICRRLDGIPLAIELAAPRVRILGIEKLADRLESDLGLLTDAQGVRPDHHRTLHAAIDWSYRLLGPAEQTLLRRLAVFSGGWSPEGAEAVCGEDGKIDGTPVLDLLMNLADLSLMVVEPGVSHRMLETVRAFAQEQLNELGEERDLRDRHLDYYLELSLLAEKGLLGPEEEDWLERLEAEHDNIRAALDWSVGSRVDGNAGLRIAFAARRFWMSRGYLVEGFTRTRALLDTGRGDPEVRARSFVGAASLAWKQGQLDAAEEMCREGIRMEREINDGQIQPGSLAMLAAILHGRGDLAAAREQLEHVLVLLEKAGNRQSMPYMLCNLGVIAAKQSDLEGAQRYYTESLMICREVGDRSTEGIVLVNLGATAQDRGDLVMARSRTEEGIAVLRATNNLMILMGGLHTLAQVDRGQGRFAEARAHALEGLQIGETSEDSVTKLSLLIEIAHIDIAEGKVERAVVLCGAIESLSQVRGVQSIERELAGLTEELGLTRESLGSERFAAALARGRGMGWEEALVIVGGSN